MKLVARQLISQQKDEEEEEQLVYPTYDDPSASPPLRGSISHYKRPRLTSDYDFTPAYRIRPGGAPVGQFRNRFVGYEPPIPTVEPPKILPPPPPQEYRPAGPTQAELAAVIAAAVAQKAADDAIAEAAAAAAEAAKKAPPPREHKRKHRAPKKVQTPEEKEANKEKRLLKLVGAVVVKCMSKYGKSLERETFKKHAKEVPHSRRFILRIIKSSLVADSADR